MPPVPLRMRTLAAGNACHYAAQDQKAGIRRTPDRPTSFERSSANPLRQVAVDPIWLHHNDGTVHKLAQAI